LFLKSSASLPLVVSAGAGVAAEVPTGGKKVSLARPRVDVRAFVEEGRDETVWYF
jgi:hypothetical protein